MKIKYQGALIASVFSLISKNSIEEIIKHSISAEVDLSLIELEPETEQERVALVRRNIALCGDTESLLGTASDNANLLLVEFSKLILALDSVTHIDDIKATAASFKTNAENLLTKIETNEYLFPYMQKGQDVVLEEITLRATSVNKAIFPNMEF